MRISAKICLESKHANLRDDIPVRRVFVFVKGQPNFVLNQIPFSQSSPPPAKRFLSFVQHFYLSEFPFSNHKLLSDAKKKK